LLKGGTNHESQAQTRYGALMQAVCAGMPTLVTMVAVMCLGAGPLHAAPSSELRPTMDVPGSASAAVHRVGSLRDVAGQWDIVSFDGYSPRRLDADGKRHAYVDISERGFSFAIECNFSGLAGDVRGGVFHRAATDPGIQTAMGCSPERERRDKAFFRFFWSLPIMETTPDEHLVMTNADHRLVLQRSSIRRVANAPALSELTGRWRVVWFTHYKRPEGSIGWGASYVPGHVVVTSSTIRYTRCPAAAVRYTYGPDYVLRRVEASRSSAPAGCGSVRRSLTEVEPMLTALLGQSPEAEKVDPGHIVLRSQDYAVLLASGSDGRRKSR
jgi:hypothetical protein